MIRREQQRFSLRKYKVGVASVFLGTTLSFLMANGGAVKASEIIAQSNSGENTELVDKDQSKDPVANVEDTVVTETSEVKSETSRPEVKSEEVKSEEAKAEKIEKKTSVSPEAKPESSKPAASSKAEEVVVAKPKAEEKTESKSEEKSEPKAELSAVAEATSLDTNASAANVEAKPLVDTETLALAAENTVNAGALATNGGRRRNRRAATEEVVSGDHNSKPIAVTTYLKDGEVATPNMTDSNGASVRSQTVPAGYSAKEGDWYTYAIWDLTRFNERYGTKYYARAYKRFDESTDTTVELLDKTTGNVLETRTITSSSGVQKFTTTTAASNSQLTFQVDYKAGTAEKGKTTQPFIQNGYEVGKSITDLVAAGHTLTPAEQTLYNAVYNARTTTDVLNVVEPAYNGRTITDSNAKIPETINKTTYYKVVDKNNPTFNANKTDKTVQDYKENGNEVDLARYTLKAEEGQRFTASGERQFDGYKLYQRADANDQSGFVNRPYTIGSKFMDADRYGIKRIKEVVGEDGSVVIRVYLLDPRQQSKRSDGSLSTDGYMLLAETKPIKPGENNTQELVVKKTPLNTIAHTVTDPKTGAKTNYPNGKEVTFDFQKAAGYTPYKSVFVPFLGDGIGHGSANAQLERGVGGIGTNVDLLNTLTPYKQPIYYYVKQDPVQVTPEVEKQLEGRSLKDGEFTFKLTEDKSSPDRYEETVTNKSGKATFSKLTFNKAGTYKYKITETKGSDTNVDYDAMTVTMTVTVTENSKGDLQATTTYSAEGGFKSSENDKIFNNYVVAPVKTKFDFSKALAGRELKAGEFTFQLKDSKGTVLQTKTNTKAGLVAFDDLTFDNTQVGTHKYTVEEVQGSEAGMTYDPMKAEVTITVTKEGHVLKATNTLPADREFNNTFTPAPVKVNLEFDKSLSNGTLNAGDFSFTLTGDNNVSETVTNKANGKINFSELSFDKVGVYNYTVKEVKGNKADVDYDAMTIAVKVTVTKDATTGLLSAKTEMTSTGGEATGADDKVFNNHVVAPVTAQFDFSKALAGRKLKAGEFSFVLKNSEGTVLQTKQNDADGKVKFDALTFTNTQVGDHKYTVEEVIPETKEAGMTYDTMKAAVTITVTKSGHALTATKSLPQDKEFNNTFTPTATQAQFKFTKRLEGKELVANAFTFELLENGNVIQTKKNAQDGSITFDAISYTQEGRHTYTVREVAGADTNIDYDSMNAVVTVTVTKDAATGLLSAKVSMPEDTEFNNYVVAPVTAQFDFSKALAGRELKAGEFTFQLKDSKGTVLQTKTNTKAGLVAFDDLTFDNTQVGTHKYTVEEVQGSEAGMQYDTMKAEVTITVTKEGHVLKATNTLPADTEFNNTFTPAATQAQFKFTKRLEGKTLEADAFTFELLENGNVIQTKKNAADGTIQFDAIAYAQEGTHTYTVREVAGADTNIDYDSMNAVVTVNVTKDAASGILTANVTMPADTEFNNFAVAPVKTKFDFSKALAGRELKAGEFTFQLKDSKGTVLQTKTNTKAGLVAFDDLTFDNTQVGTHKYTVEEVQGSEAGMQYDTMKAEVTITVTKEGHVLKATHTLPADTEFNNTFTPAATQAQFKFTKKLEGKELTKDAFTFELLENGNVIQTKKNAADGSITFDAIEYNAVGEHTYTVREVAGADTNIDYDSMNAVVTVNVTKDAASGILTANVTMPADTEFNNYHVAPVVARFDFTKKLAGRELKEGEFSFVLKDSTGQTLETVTNKADGTVTFSELSFDNTKVGTHTYTVEEVIPASKELGMTYDTMKATITVEVSKKGHALTTVTNVTSTGGVDADGSSTDGTADKEFNNKVTPPEAPEFQPEKFVLNKEKFDITGTKLVDDDDELTDEYTATNANPYADGTSNNEAENINTKTVERGDKLVYQVWLDTKNFTDKNNIQSVGISDTYDAEKLTVNAADIKAYDSESGDDVTDKFDIKVENGVITATSKTSVNKSLGDADNTQVIDTTKFAFGRYYKFDIPATVKADVAGGVDIENKANQIVHVYNPVNKSVEKPEKPTQKRVNSVPISVEFNFTKRLEGRELKANEFSFVLKDSEGKTLETVSNDASGNVKFSKLEFKKGQEGVHNYTVEEVKGSDATVTYDTMKANVTVTVKHNGTAKVLVATVGDIADKEFNNTVRPPEEPKFQPEKYVVSEEKFDITGDKLVDDDKELADKYGDTNKDPYADKTDNNEAQNLNTKTVKRGDKLVYQVWLDTTKFDAANKDNIQSVGISDDYDETKLDLDATKIKAYDSVTGDDVTAKFDITVNNGVITATLKDGFTKSLGDAENTQVIDTTKFAFGRYYKFDIPTKVKADVPGGVDIENTAAQVVNYYNPVSKTVEKPNKPTEKRVNSVPVEVEFNFTKRLEGRELKANEFSFVLKDSEGKTLETVSNDASGNVKFSKLEFKKDQAGVHNYTVEEVKGSDATVTYDTMKANVTVTVKHDGTAKVLVATVGEIADKEFNNVVTPPEEPKFQPEKYVLNEEKFDITGDKLVDDDKELADKYGDTNKDPYADKTDNNEAQNLNTKTVKRGDKLVYQVWLDTTKFDAANKDNIQSVGISDDYDETKLDLDATKIKAYDSVTGDDVTAKFDITVNNGVITATLKDGFTKSLGDAENTQVIDTTKFAFGRYYKFDIPTKVKADVPGGVDIENTAAQVVNYYNPTTKKVEKPSKPTEKRVNSVPVQVEFNFTKRLEGRELKANEFSFVLKDSTGKVVETVTNDASGNVKFSAIEFKKEQAGVHNYTVEEVAGTDATVTYDTMKANVTVTVSHDGTAKVLVATVGEIADKEFNNRVTPPEEPKFQPEKYVVTEEKFDITGDKLLDDDKELKDKVADTNANPYADDASNNEAENLNTKTVKPGAKLVYQVWLDTTKFDAANKDNIQTVSISDDFDETKVDVDASAIKAYDSVTGADVTDKFDIKVEAGVMTATLKAGFTKSLGDAENTQIIDTTKFAFGRYYKFDIPATVKADVAAGADIENTAAQVVNYYNPTTKKVEKPEKPTEKRVNSVPISVDFNFTKKLEGRELKAGEFSFVLKAEDGTPIETVQNDKDGNVKFKAIEYKKGQEGTYKYTIEEVKGTDATVTYDSMKAEVTVVVEHNGKAKALVKTVTDAPDKEFNNVVTPPEEPKFQPEKYVVSEEKFDITGDKLLDDDSELTDKYGETNTNPYVDGTSNNEAQNLNTKTVKPGAKLVYQVWLDTTKFDAANKDNIQTVSISDDFDETKVDVDASAIKAYDSVTGNDVTDKFDIKVEGGVMTATLKAGFTKSLGDAENTQVIDTTKFAFGRYYKFDIPATVKADVAAGADIENTAAQVVNYYNPTTKKVEKPEKPTEKRVNSVPISVDFNFTKKLEGRELKAGEFSFVLKDAKGKEIETVQNDKDGNVKFKAIEYKKGQEGTYKYTIEEVKGSDATVTYDSMKAEVTVVVEHNGKAKALVKTVTDATDKEFNNVVTPPEEPKFQPEKYVVSEEKYSITDNKLLDDDSELKDKVADTNANPYADDASNNEAENLNTKTVKPGAKLVYQVWLDTTKFDAANKDNIQTVSISDDFDETKVDVDASAIKAYDSVTGDDVTDKFDIKIENGVMTATLKAGFTKSLGDAENTQIIDTTKFAFGRYYKFDIPATVKTDVAAGVDIENTAAQVVNYYNPTTKKVEKPEKPTEKRVNSVPISVDFNFTKKLEGRELKANEFSFVLKDSTGKVVETVTNDASGNVKFSAIEFKKEQAGVHNYTVEEVAGTDATVTYDTMKANVTVTVKHDGTAKVLIATVGDIADKEFNNVVTPPEEPKFQPEKYVVSEEKFDITGDKLVDDDKELADKYADTNANPYADDASNNEAQNLNTKTVKRGDKLVYQVWLDTTKFDAANKDNIQSVGISDDYDETKLDLDATKIKAYDSVTGDDVTAKFDITVEGGVITATLKAGFTKSLGDAENTQVIDTTKFAFGRYYKFDIPTTVKADVAAGVDIENTAAQVVNYYNPTSKTVEKPSKPTEKRVNSVPVQVEFNFTKRLEGRELKAGEFSFVLKDSTGKVVETVTNDASGNVKFSAIEFKKEQAGVHNYTVEEVAGTDATVTYDTMKANVTVTVSHDGTAKVLVATVGDIADKEFNNVVTPPEEPKFQPEKYIVSEEKFDITGDKLVDDDKELADKVADTNANPYADDASNNEAQNLNTKTVKRGDKLVYQVWLDTTKFDAANKDNIQSVGISDDYDETKLDLDATKIKAYDSVTGDDVTAKFDITVEGGVITATLKAGFTKSLGDAENTQVIDTTKFAFGRYYKFDIPTTVKADVAAGVDIENTAAQVVNYYNPTSKTVEKPSKPTEKRVNSVPVQVEFNFTKRLEGRELKAGEFSFVLKDSTGKVVETVTNDASGNVKFSAIEFKKDQAGVHNYTVEEVAGTDATVTYDTMKANVTVTVSHDGTAKVLVATVGDIADKEFNNTVRPPEEPKFQPEKYVVSEEKFDITGDKLVDDDKELADKVADTNANPYADDASNNEAQNLNTKTVKRGDKLVYQVWLDTTKFDAANKDNIQSVGISDDYDETKLDLDATKIKAYDSVTGDDVTAKFDITVNNGVITATLKAGFTKSLGDAENTQIIDTTKFAFGRYYKFDIPATVKTDVAAGADIENTAAQVVNYYNPTTKKVEKPSKPTEKRVNSVPVQVEFNFTKRLEGRELKANEFSFVLKDSTGKVVETVTNDASGNVKFSAIEFKKEQAGVHNYTVEEVKGSDATVTYDTMKANVTVTVSHDGTAKVLVATVGDIADKEFNNVVTPPEEPKFQPEKYVVSEEKFDITGDKLVDDDKELADKVADTNANPYADDASNNEAQNLNTKTVKRGDKLVYQVWLDTTKFDAANKDNIQSVGISDDYDETKLDLDATKIKAYDSVTGDDVTAKFDITVEGGVITATLKAGFTKSLGDAENTQVIDTTKFAFGRYYKFDIPTTVKADVAAGVDIENTAAQVVNYYNPTSKTVEKPSKPTEKRVNSVPVQVEFNFTKRLEGRELKAGEFSFVLKDSTGKVVETVTNDASGNVKFSAIEFKKEQAGVHNYTVEEVKGSDATVTYDTMKANVTVTVSHDGTAKVLVATVGDIADKEFNNRVTPPEEPKFQPEKYVVSEEKFDITGDKLVDDDSELKDKVADTNANPYADGTTNNEVQNINTKTVKRGDKLVYQVWLDTTKFDAANKDNIQSVGISDDYDETKLDLDSTKIKAYDSVTGDDVTAKFDITVEGGVITATLKAGFTKSLGDAENTQVIDTTKFAFGRYYKFDIPTTVKADVAAGVDIENTAAQVVNYYNPTSKTVEKPSKPTEKRVNSVPVQVEFNFTKRLEGRELKANEFSFVLKDSTGKVVETVTNDASGNVKFSAIEFKKEQAGVHNYTVEEVKGSDATVTYDTMKANVTVTVSHDGTAKVLVATVGDIADKEFNNRVTPPEEPKFQPEKYVVSEEKFDITGDKLVDDDSELKDKVADTNANPYADGTTNNEVQNINTKTVKRGDKLVYQVWLDTTKFDAANKDNIQSVGISDDYDETKLDLDSTKIKAYDSVTGDDVTAKFDITVEGGVITATLKAGFTKSLGDAENTQVIDTTKFAFGRYYKFDIPTTVKADVAAGVDIENTAAQVVNYYNPTSKTVEKPSKPTEKRVNSVPVQVEFNFTKRLEGRELKANEFSFVLKDSTGKVVETVTNDASGNVKFSAIEFKKEQAGVHNYTVEEVAGTDATVTYDTMKANVTVTVSHDGTAKAIITNVTDPADKEFNNTVRPPEIPEFNPEKYILNESKFDLTGTKLLDDDSELKDKVADTNANPYADGTANNEAQNINTKTLKKGDKVYYQVWLDTTKFTEAHNIQSVGVTDKYDSANLNVNGADIKAYDSVTGEDVTAKFDIKVENGVITATSKADLTKSLGDAENTQVIDTTKLAFGRYYKFEIPAEIKQSAQEGVDIENTASQIVHQYDPTKKSVEKPEKPTEKRVVNIPVKVQFQFTKKLEGRELKAGEFSFVLKDEKGNVIETVTNDAAGKIQFSALEFKRGEEGTHLYHVEEIRGTDSSVVYDKMVATVGIVVKKDGKVLVATTQLPEDTEFNNKVTPPTPPIPPTPVTPPTPEKPKGRELPNTGEKSTAGVAALGATLGLAGLGLVVKRKKEDEA